MLSPFGVSMTFGNFGSFEAVRVPAVCRGTRASVRGHTRERRSTWHARRQGSEPALWQTAPPPLGLACRLGFELFLRRSSVQGSGPAAPNRFIERTPNSTARYTASTLSVPRGVLLVAAHVER